jgi:hypothetical protein
MRRHGNKIILVKLITSDLVLSVISAYVPSRS